MPEFAGCIRQHGITLELDAVMEYTVKSCDHNTPLFSLEIAGKPTRVDYLWHNITAGFNRQLTRLGKHTRRLLSGHVFSSLNDLSEQFQLANVIIAPVFKCVTDIQDFMPISD